MKLKRTRKGSFLCVPKEMYENCKLINNKKSGLSRFFYTHQQILISFAGKCHQQAQQVNEDIVNIQIQ